MNAFIYHFGFEFRSSIRNRAKLVVNYLLPLGLYAMMGLIMGPIIPGFREIIIPAIFGKAVMLIGTERLAMQADLRFFQTTQPDVKH